MLGYISTDQDIQFINNMGQMQNGYLHCPPISYFLSLNLKILTKTSFLKKKTLLYFFYAEKYSPIPPLDFSQAIYL